ncbi:portal protein [Clavibacter phage 33]|nr:portal protein [Clavibacter phage 33]
MSQNLAVVRSPEGDAAFQRTMNDMIFGGAFEGAKQLNRQTALWSAPSLPPDMEIAPDKVRMDARTRDLIRNDGYIQGALDTSKDSIVGGQYLLNARPDWRSLGFDEKWAEEFQLIAERKFMLYAESPMNWIDASRKNGLTGLVRMALAQAFMAGETLATSEYLKGNGRPYRTAINMIDPDRLSNPNDNSDTAFLRRGVEIDRYGAAQAYHIRDAHPMESYYDRFGAKWTRVPAFKPWGRPQVIHIADILRPGQTRGVSQMVAVLKEMRMTKVYKDIVLQNAVVNATFAAAIESELPRDMVFAQLGSGDMSWLQKYMGALAEYVGSSDNLAIDGVRIPHLFPGTKLNLQNAGQPGGVGSDFEDSLLRHICAALGLSYEQFSKDYSKTNYSSARASMIETWKFMQSRKKLITDRFATMIYMLWLEEEINRPDTDLPMPKGAAHFYEGINREAYIKCDWIGASRGQIDELKETQAAVLRIASGLSTYEDELGKLGKDYREVFEQHMREQRLIEQKKLNFTMSTSKPGTQKATDSAANDDAKADAVTETETENDDE